MSQSSTPLLTKSPQSLTKVRHLSTDSSSAASTARPLTRRFLSTEQELLPASSLNAPSTSRATSPLPSKHPSRSTQRVGSNGRILSPVNHTRDIERNGRSSPVGLGGMLEGGWTSSWSTLQGIASSVLGGEPSGKIEDQQNTSYEGPQSRPRKRDTAASKKVLDTWGPDGQSKKDNSAGRRAISERERALKTRQTVGILEGGDDIIRALDMAGKYKRRSSMEDDSFQGQQDDSTDAMAYIHHVQPDDTLAGVVLRYNCQSAVFKKANRFWPNDSIQTRKVVVLPVDACAIKGRPCEPPSSSSQETDLLAPTPGEEEAPINENSQTWPSMAAAHKAISAGHPSTDEGQAWVHVRWVLIDSLPGSKPVEIARMPRKALGYFPPRRRKSETTLSTISTPRASSETNATSQPLSSSPSEVLDIGSSTPVRNISSVDSRVSPPSGSSYFPSSASGSRIRRGSIDETADKLGWMRGPGGVGTFKKNVRKPGPAQDGLNSWAKKHIPGLVLDYLPSASITGTDSAHIGFNNDHTVISEEQFGKHVRGESTITRSNSGLGLETAASAVEGWVRRLAKGPGTPRIGAGKTESADLIELLDGPGSDDGRGFELGSGSTRSAIRPTLGGREDLEGLFRGRTASATKGSKTD